MEDILLIGHIAGGAISVVTGLVALFTRKGARVHRAAGAVFTVAILLTAASAAYLGFAHSDSGDIAAAVLTIYLVATAWVTARREDKQTGVFEVGAFLVAGAGASAMLWLTLQSVQAGTALFGGIPGFIFSGVIALTALFDLNVILRGGLTGAARIARHLWRMHLAFFIAVGSFFPGQLHLFPEYIREIKPIIILFLPAFSIFALMFFWLARVRLTKWLAKRGPAPAAATAVLAPVK